MEHRIYHLLNNDFNNLNIQILENELFHGDQHWVYNDVVSSFNRMYFMISGKAYIENNSTRYHMETGKIYLIPAGSKNNYRCTTEVNKFYLHFQISLLLGIDLFLGLEDVLVLDYSEELLDDILTCAEDSSITSLLHLKVIFTDICAQFYELAISKHDLLKKQRGYFKQEKVLLYISEHLSSKLRISDVADAFQLPYYQITREFKKDTGISLKKYIESQLLHRIKYLLLNSGDSITQIAEQLGFCDPYYLSRFFRKYELESPREYRQKRKTNIL